MNNELNEYEDDVPEDEEVRVVAHPAKDVPEDAPDLTFEDIQNARDRDTERIYIKQWKGHVTVRGLSLRQTNEIRRLRKMAAKIGKSPDDVVLGETLVHGLVSPTITRKQYELMKDKNVGAMATIAEAINRLSGQTEEEAADLEAEFPE